jgi:hypothetical protein
MNEDAGKVFSHDVAEDNALETMGYRPGKFGFPLSFPLQCIADTENLFHGIPRA